MSLAGSAAILAVCVTVLFRSPVQFPEASDPPFPYDMSSEGPTFVAILLTLIMQEPFTLGECVGDSRSLSGIFEREGTDIVGLY